MKKLSNNFLYPSCICVFSNFEKIFLKSAQNFNKLYWNIIYFIIINAKFSQKYSKFFPNIPKILFEIYFKFPINLIQDLSKIILIFFLKTFATFISENFPEICANFSKNFLKNLIKFSIKFYFEHCSNFTHSVPKISRKLFTFCRLSTNFYYNFITSQHFHHQLIKVFCESSSILL